MNGPTTQGAICPLYHHAVELIGRRWTGVIVRALADGAVRFGDVIAAVPGLSDRMLSERLKELEAEEIVTRLVIPDYPVRVEYRLTAKGQDLGAVMDAIGAWAHHWLAGEATPAAVPSATPPGTPVAEHPARIGLCRPSEL